MPPRPLTIHTDCESLVRNESSARSSCSRPNNNVVKSSMGGAPCGAFDSKNSTADENVFRAPGRPWFSQFSNDWMTASASSSGVVNDSQVHLEPTSARNFASALALVRDRSLFNHSLRLLQGHLFPCFTKA